MNGERMNEVLYAVGLGVEVLSGDLARLQQELQQEKSNGAAEKFRADRAVQAQADLRGQVDAANANSRALRNEVNDLRARLTSKEESAMRLLDDYDGLTLRLWNYAEELEAARDVERVKSSKVMLGHIVERLKEIHAYRSVRHQPGSAAA